MKKVVLWVVLEAGLVFVFVVLALVLAGCIDDGTPTVSPVVTPTFPPSPLVAENRAEGGRHRTEPYGTVERVQSSNGEEVRQMEQVPEIGGFEVVFLVMGIVSLLKTFGINGKGSLAAALVLGALFNGLALALTAGMLPEAVAVWVVLAVRAVGYTLAIPGLYDLLKDQLLPAIGKSVMADPFKLK